MAELGPATLVGRYQLVAAIGAGGMGRVWVALDTAAPSLRLVALKTALAQVQGGPSSEFWAMLSDEAALASRIGHPNVCATHELGHEAGIHYLVMEWSDGSSLRDLLDATPGRRLAPELAAYIGASVAAGLHAAHELTDHEGHQLGVVHRDVSPQNVLVSTRGQVRLADFGVAKARGQQHRPTETGEVKGKLSYMAPEQVASKDIDRRADVFALGCLLYEAVLGVRPFHGADALATMYKILEEELTRPRLLDATFPEALEAVLLKALAKDRAARHATAEELRAELLEYLSSTRCHMGDKQVAQALAAVLGEPLRERNSAIRATAQRLLRGETDSSRLQSPPPPAPTATLTPDGGIERSVALAGMGRAPDRGRFWLLAGGLALMVAVAVGGRFWSTRAPDPVPAKPAGAAGLPWSASASSVPSAPLLDRASASISADSPAVAARTASAELSTPNLPGSRGRARPTPRPSASGLPSVIAKPQGRVPRPIDRSNPFANP